MAAADFGVMRHYRSSEDLFLHLQDSSGADITGVTLGALSMNCEVVKPDGTTYSKTTGQPGSTLTSLGQGMYKLKLWGEGQSAGVDGDLNQVGNHTVRIWHGTGAFLSQTIAYRVAADWDIQLAVTYTPGAAGTDQLTGSISFYRWWSKERFSSPITRGVPITSYQLKISDVTTANLTTVSGSDFTEGIGDTNLYFTKAILGLTGSRALNARLTFTYSGIVFTRDFPLIARFAA